MESSGGRTRHPSVKNVLRKLNSLTDFVRMAAWQRPLLSSSLVIISLGYEKRLGTGGVREVPPLAPVFIGLMSASKHALKTHQSRVLNLRHGFFPIKTKK